MVALVSGYNNLVNDGGGLDGDTYVAIFEKPRIKLFSDYLKILVFMLVFVRHESKIHTAYTYDWI